MERLRINFDTLGDRSAASSRLRAWMIADELRSRGHAVTINGDLGADVQVFQKVRPQARLAEARRSGALVVADFDDNYLLSEVGTREDVVRFLNEVDLVTVGSPYLLEVADAFHDRVALLENPLDVPPNASLRPRRGWQGRVCWFGNPANLIALDDLDLGREVTTITAGGDIVWSAETIDEELRRFDAVLLPVVPGEWGLAKNANRLLKCVALGVPVLASASGEHLRVAEILDLPAQMILAEGDDWDARLEWLEESFEEVLGALDRAREVAVAHYGLEATTDAWLLAVAEARSDRVRRSSLRPDVRGALGDTDVVIFAEDDPSALELTLDSLRLVEAGARSLAVVSALPAPLSRDGPPEATVLDAHSEFFEVYESLGRVLEGGGSGDTLFLRAGARLTRGFFSAAAARNGDRALWLPGAQFADSSLVMAPAPASFVELLGEPFVPDAFVCANAMLREVGPTDTGLMRFCLWELLIRLALASGRRFSADPLALVVVPRPRRERTPADAFAAYVAVTAPALVDQLSNARDEWARLRHVLVMQVVERHRDLYSEYVSALIPALDLRWMLSEQAKAKLEDAVALAGSKKGRATRVVTPLESAVARVVGSRESAAPRVVGSRESAAPRVVGSRESAVAPVVERVPPSRLAPVRQLASWVRRGPSPGLRLITTYVMLWRSGRFDRDFYLAAHTDVAAAGLDPLMHFVEHGWRGDHDPNPHFSTRQYLDARPEVEHAGINPLLHYLRSADNNGSDKASGAAEASG